MTPSELAEIKERAEKASEMLANINVLYVKQKDGFINTAHLRPNDVQFIAHARTDIPKLISEVERLRKILAKELSENDELGAEYAYVCSLKEENTRLREALKFYANNDSWLCSYDFNYGDAIHHDDLGPHPDSKRESVGGKIARAALGEGEVKKERDALKAENEDLKVINQVLTDHSGKLESKLLTRVAKLREALKIVSEKDSGDGVDEFELAIRVSREALAQDDEEEKK